MVDGATEVATDVGHGPSRQCDLRHQSRRQPVPRFVDVGFDLTRLDQERAHPLLDSRALVELLLRALSDGQDICDAPVGKFGELAHGNTLFDLAARSAFGWRWVRVTIFS